ncbi:MAG: hypothetical protein U1F34_00170 [Gammaproteobacteria bacterium]
MGEVLRIWISEGRRLRVTLALLFCLHFLLYSPLLFAGSGSLLDCTQHRCDLLKDGAYQEFIIGTVAAVGTDDDTRGLVKWAKLNGFWSSALDDTEAYVRTATVVLINVAGITPTAPIPVLVTKTELGAATLKPGDLLRYGPHIERYKHWRGDPAETGIYNELTGYYIILCGHQNMDCFKDYVQGAFNRQSGRQIEIFGKQEIANGVVIDTKRLQPVSNPSVEESESK